MQGTAAIGTASGSASAGLLFAVLRAVFQQGQLPDPCLTALPALAAIETENLAQLGPLAFPDRGGCYRPLPRTSLGSLLVASSEVATIYLGSGRRDFFSYAATAQSPRRMSHRPASADSELSAQVEALRELVVRLELRVSALERRGRHGGESFSLVSGPETFSPQQPV